VRKSPHRDHRHGQLFQNRYKSILCQHLSLRVGPLSLPRSSPCKDRIRPESLGFVFLCGSQCFSGKGEKLLARSRYIVGSVWGEDKCGPETIPRICEGLDKGGAKAGVGQGWVVMRGLGGEEVGCRGQRACQKIRDDAACGDHLGFFFFAVPELLTGFFACTWGHL